MRFPKLFALVTIGILVFSSTQPASATDIVLTVGQEQVNGYDRALFKLWIDADRDGCNTRNEVLIEEATIRPNIGKGCKLTGGRWISPYDQKTVTNSSLLDIDHVVPLSEAWKSGAWSWNSTLRQQYANELREPAALVAVSLSLNRQKGDKDVAHWMPPKNQCKYIADWITVKATYSLTVDPIEAETLRQYIIQCLYTNVRFSTEVAPTPTPSPVVIPTPTPTPTPSPVVIPTPTPTPESFATNNSVQSITPGSFCSPAGAIGQSSKGVSYTCKSSSTDARNRWRL